MGASAGSSTRSTPTSGCWSSARRSTARRASCATVERIPKQTTVVTIEGDINRETNSLTAAIDKAGERIELALGIGRCVLG